MKNVIVSNLAPIGSNDLKFFMELECSLNKKGYKVYFWSCIKAKEFRNYIHMSWDINNWERFEYKLNGKQKETAHKLVDKDKWLPRIEKLVKQTNSDITEIYNTIVYNSYYLLESMDVEIFFSWNNLCPHSGILNDMCASRSIERFLVERGNFPNTWYLEKGGLLGHSTIANKALSELGITKEHYNIGKRFLDNLQFDNEEKYVQNTAKETLQKLKDLKSITQKEGTPLIVMFPPDDGTIGFFPSEHSDRKMTLPHYENSFEAAKMIAKKSHAFVIFKPHPSFIGWKYDLEGMNNLFVIDYDYKYLIELSDIVASTGSGLGLIALANNKPLISQSVDILYKKGITYEALESNSIQKSVSDAYKLADYDLKMKNLYFFVGYMMKEYMITLQKEKLYSPSDFIEKNVKDRKTFLKRLFNAIF